MKLTRRQWTMIRAIISGRLAWIPIKRNRTARILQSLGLITLWSNAGDAEANKSLADGPFATLTPWGAWLLGVKIRERKRIRWITTRHPDGTVTRERELVEEPHWVRTGEAYYLDNKPNKIVSQARMILLKEPELVPDPRSTNETYLSDSVGPIIILGRYVLIDPRLERHHEE